MVENSKEGTAEANYFGAVTVGKTTAEISGTDPGTNDEHYYYVTNTTACPAGWHRPTVDEGRSLANAVGSPPPSYPDWWRQCYGLGDTSSYGKTSWGQWGERGYWGATATANNDAIFYRASNNFFSFGEYHFPTEMHNVRCVMDV
jgi:hypothetical protein